jgi:hypothetical protein
MLENTTQTLSVVVDIAVGQVLEEGGPAEANERLIDFAATSPDLFSAEGVDWDALFAALEVPPGDTSFQDLVLVGEAFILVAQRLASDPGLALLSVVPADKGVGLAISEARDQVLALSRR